jgi:Animal haem peroxidase
MRRINHGSTTPPSNKSTEEVLNELGTLVDEFYFPIATKPVVNTPFTYMFEKLANDKKCLIPATDQTLQHLSELGAAMRDTEFDPQFDSMIPAAYTYFAQLVNHDINFTDVQKENNETDFQLLAGSKLEPWTDEMILKRVSNKRAGMLELDCVYGRIQANVLPPRDKDNPDKMALGKVSPSPFQDQPEIKDVYNDLVRGPKSENLKDDRTALIADRRNDSNLILSQLHVAFLKAHNRIIDEKKCSYEEAKQILQKYYHWLILEDFLPAIVPQEIIESVRSAPRYHASDGLPLEFSVGAFRFGHSMVRRNYYLNDNYPGVSLTQLFTSIVLCNGIGPEPGKGSSNITEDRVIQWENFFNGTNLARDFRPQMVEPLFELFDEINIEVPGERSLAVQDLKRSYMMRIPTGQSIASQLGVKHPLTPADFEEVSTPRQFQALKDAEMLECTPLSFYVLAEAAKAKNGKLGEVGGRIVAEVLIGLLRDRPDSIIKSGWKPESEMFSLFDLLGFAGVLEDA